MANILSIKMVRGPEYNDWLPNVVRITRLSRASQDSGLVQNTARVLHGSFEGTLCWTSQHADIRLKEGKLVRVEWPEQLSEICEQITVRRVVLLESPLPHLNLFQSIPDTWVKDRALIKEAAKLWDELPPALQELFNELFWDCYRFRRYVTAPGSLSGHHNGWNGNLRHALDVAKKALRMADGINGISSPLLVLAALIHDAGKANEYQWNGRHWIRTEAGSLIGHKDILKAWMGAVLERRRDLLPESHRMALWHILFSTRNAPAYLDTRESCMLEADILSLADRLSGSEDLYSRHGNREGGFGLQHPHLRARPYRISSIG